MFLFVVLKSSRNVNKNRLDIMRDILAITMVKAKKTRIARASLLLISDFNRFYFRFIINGQVSVLQLSLLGLR